MKGNALILVSQEPGGVRQLGKGEKVRQEQQEE